MKKLDHTEWLNRIIPKFYLKMKFIILFLTVILFQAQANSGYSQNKKISLDLKEASLLEVFEEIESKTDFNFFYKTEDIDKNKRVSIRVKNRKVGAILKDMFHGTDISFVLLNKQIVIQKKQLDSSVNKNAVKPATKDVEIAAQIDEIIIKGKITDENGDPLPGATVVVKGKNIGVSTDMEGAFSLIIPDGTTTLVISFVGYKTLEVEIGDRVFLDIQLDTDIASLSEVVVIGYGTVKKEDLTGSVGVVKVENIINQAPTVNLDHALQGQISGVYVSSATGQPGAAARVRIRGTTSLFGSNQPLYVIDGIPIVPNSNIPMGGSEGGNLGTSFEDQGISTPLGNINSADIESISVLKDASAAAIYGSRAANGVIIINTKRGAYGSAPKFSVDYSISTQTPRTLEVLNAAQFREVWTTAVENGSSTNAFAQSVLDGSYFGDADTNWEDEVSPTSPITSNFNVSVLGGSDKTRYSTSIGINNQDGIYEGTSFDRYTFNLNLDTDVNDIWKFGSKLNLSFTDQKTPDVTLTHEIYNYRPDVPVIDSLGNFGFSSTYSSQNPVALSKATNSNKTLFLLGSFFTELRLAEGLHLKTSLALRYNNGNQQSFYPKFTSRGGWTRFGGGTDGDGYAQESRSRSTSTIWRNTLTFNKSFNNHTVDALLAAEFQKDNDSFTKAWGEGFYNNVLANISSATVFTEASGNETFTGLASYIGRVNYNYTDKYFFTFTARVDGSSKFGAGNQYAFFPAAAAAWKISNESFLENSRFVDELKLRVSAGTTGQQDFGPYVWRTLYSTFNYAGDPSIISTQLGNDKLKWETTDQFDIGLDFSLLKGRVSGVFNYYTKVTNDALFFAKPPSSVGTANNATIVANVGSTLNKGIELELNGDVISTSEFNWNISFNITKNTNELTKISDDFKDEEGFLTSFPGGGRLREGSPIGLIYGYVSEGIFQTQDEIDALNTGSETGIYQNTSTSLGDFKFRDITGLDGVPDGRITNLDQQVIGDTQPDFFGGINSTWSYKGFSLSAFFTYSIGNDLYAFSLANNQNFWSPRLGENKTTDILNAWTPENTNTNIPRVVYRNPNFNNRRSSRYVYDASYLRLRTLSLNYTFSNVLVQKTGFMSSASIYVTAQNLLTITNYPGADPETASRFNNDISAGNDGNRFPIAKVYTVGVRVAF